MFRTSLADEPARRPDVRKELWMRGLRVPIVIGLLFAVLWIAGTGAKAQPYPPPTVTVIASFSVPPPTITLPPPTDPSVPPPTGPPPPITGADLTTFVLLGAGLTAAGAGFVHLARKRSHDA